MQKVFVPQTIIPGVRRRVDPETLMAMSDEDGKPLWNMPAPTGYAEHRKWRKHKATGARIAEPVMVPVYRGALTSYVRWVKAQLRRNKRKAAEAQAEADALDSKETAAHLADLILNPGEHNVEV